MSKFSISLQGQKAIVTGATSGIGQAIAIGLAQAGAIVGVNYRGNRAKAEPVLAEIQASGGEAIAFTIPMPAKFDVCHCVDCRRWHGTSVVGVDSTNVTLVGKALTLKWFASSDYAERGFCRRCGSSLFYRLKSNLSKWSVYIGALTNIPEHISLGTQHFLAQKPDVYTLASGQKF